MAELLFIFFAVLTVASALGVVLSRNPVNGAMFMIVAFVGMGALFVQLEAYFLAVVQVLVYAGAVVVLFLFIIMLLDVGDEKESRKPGWATLLASVVAFALLVAGVLHLFIDFASPPAVLDEVPASVSANFGRELFTKYLLPFQVAGFLLLVAMIGVILLSKRTPVLGPEADGKGGRS